MDIGCMMLVKGRSRGRIREPLPLQSQTSWYDLKTRESWTDRIRDLLCESRPFGEESIETRSEQKDVQTLENSISMTTVEESETIPPIISLEGPDVDPETGSFAVLSQYLINKTDTLERQFQKWYTSLMLGLGKTPG